MTGRNGAAMSRRQLEQAVLAGRRLTIRGDGGWTVTGYLAGLDDYHYLIVSDEGGVRQTRLVHKSAPLVDVDVTPTYDLHRTEWLESIIGPFREAIINRRTTSTTPVF